jgi:prephenate dehydratase
VAAQQCRQFLDQNTQWQVTIVDNTVSAARLMIENNQPGEAAIGSDAAAQLYGLNMLMEGIETNPRNYTRFVVIGKSPLADRTKTKSSIVFSTLNEPGALFEVMKIFADNHVNLVKLESRPIHGKPWQYMFYADIEADIETSAIQEVLSKISSKTDILKELGSY